MGVTISVKKGREYLGFWVFVKKGSLRYSKLCGSEKAAKLYKAKIEMQWALGNFANPTQSHATTVAAYFEKWMSQHARVNLRATTVAGYEIAWTCHLAPTLGHLALTDLTRDQVQEVVSAMRKAGRSSNTILATLAPLSAMCTYAIRAGDLAANPVTPCLPKRKKSFVGKAFTQEEVLMILDTARQHFSHQTYLLVLTLAHMGLRHNEVLGLCKRDLNFTAGLLRVSQDTAKGAKERWLPMPPPLVAALAPWVESLPSTALVFRNSRGQKINQSNFRNREWKPLLLKAGLPPARVHDMRHSFASFLLYDLRISPAVVQQMLGHNSIKVTVDMYGHPTAEQHRDVAGQLGDYLKSGRP